MVENVQARLRWDSRRTPNRQLAARKLLLAAARPSTDQDELAALLHRVDPDEIADLAEHHRIATLLHRRLVEVAPLPERLAERFETSGAAAQAIRLHAHRSIRALDDALTTPFLVVKGVVLANHWYAEPAEREFSDVDVLVDRTTFEQAVNGLSAAGFEVLATNWQGFADHGVAEVPFGYEASVIDLHWNLVGLGAARQTLRLSTVDMFERAVSVDVAGRSVLTLDPVDTAVHLCVNVGLDGARRLRGLVDIDTVIRSGSVDMDEFVERSLRAGAGPMNAAVLQRCRTLLETPIPTEAIRRCAGSRSWLRANDIIDRARTGRRPDAGIASGVLLSSGRNSWTATAQALTESIRIGLSTRAGRPSLTDAGGELDWDRPPTEGTIESQRRRYLDEVTDPTTRIRRVPCVDLTDLHAKLGEFQPRSTPLLGAAFTDGIRGRRCRAELFEFDDGSLAAATVRYRWTIGRMTAYPLLLDDRAAPAVGNFLQRSGATDLSGMAQDTDPLRPHLPRWRGAVSTTPAWQPPGFIWEAPGDDVRVATRQDLDDLVDAVWNHSPHAFPNRLLLRRRLERAVDQLVLVVEAGTPPQSAGFGILDSSTPEYDFWAQVVILPQYREMGLSWRLVAAGAAAAARRGAGGMVCVVDTNPMTLPSDATTGELWNYVVLSPPRRFRGEVRLRRALDRLLETRSPPVRNLQPVMRTPGPGDERVADRRTQQRWQLESDR